MCTYTYSAIDPRSPQPSQIERQGTRRKVRSDTLRIYEDSGLVWNFTFLREFNLRFHSDYLFIETDTESQLSEALDVPSLWHRSRVFFAVLPYSEHMVRKLFDVIPVSFPQYEPLMLGTLSSEQLARSFDPKRPYSYWHRYFYESFSDYEYHMFVNLDAEQLSIDCRVTERFDEILQFMDAYAARLPTGRE